MIEVEGITLYTIKETAKQLSISEQTVRRYIKTGRLKGKRIGRPVLITSSELKRFITEADSKNKPILND